MTQEKYMHTLRERLNQLNIEGREDILNDFEAHFTLGKQNGHSDEELMESSHQMERLAFSILRAARGMRGSLVGQVELVEKSHEQ